MKRQLSTPKKIPLPRKFVPAGRGIVSLCHQPPPPAELRNVSSSPNGTALGFGVSRVSRVWPIAMGSRAATLWLGNFPTTVPRAAALLAALASPGPGLS